MSVRVIAASSYLQPVRDGEALPSLDQALKDVSREHFRRVDRFIQLALIGSGRCVAGQALRPECGIYLGSGFGPIASNVATQQQMLRDHEIPKPYNFVNTLGVSAGFHVAKNLGMPGQNLFISRRGASLEAALATALTDLELGVLSQALVGVVEEVTLPLDEHRRRRDLPSDALVAEGSHWLLLERDAARGKSVSMKHFDDLGSLERELNASCRENDRVHRPQAVDKRGRDGRAFHDNPDAAVAAEFAAAAMAGSLFLANGSPGRGYTLLHLGP